ncbi:hypothetical protein GS039_001461 [Salmonella enterica]|nr:hypothetical protein [Salmonella enterica]EEJ5818849.1 hypothetical protein [Salmonella enterica]
MDWLKNRRCCPGQHGTKINQLRCFGLPEDALVKKQALLPGAARYKKQPLIKKLIFVFGLRFLDCYCWLN